MRDLHLVLTARDGVYRAGWVLSQGGSLEEHGAVAVDEGGGYHAELRATVEALSHCEPGAPLHLHTSGSLQKTVTEWMPGWREKGWKKKRGVIQYLPLVQQVDAGLQGRALHWSALVDDDPLTKTAAMLASQDDVPVQQRPPATIAASDCPVIAYSDGGCRGNPGGIGGWGMVLLHQPSGTALLKRGGAPDTTNNRMELTAAIEALTALTRDGTQVELRSDSQYVINAATKWITGWKRNNWRTRSGDDVANADLMRQLDAQLQRHRVRWTWVRGHTGEAGNECADQLANEAMDAIARDEDPIAERRERDPFRIVPGHP